MTTPNPNTDNATAAVTATAPRYTDADIAAAVARGLRNARDLPDPVDDADRSPLKYAAMAQDFRNGAWLHLDAGDLPQASNKAWGLAAETVKAVSARHGGFIHKHRGIMEVVTQLCLLAADSGAAPAARRLSRSFRTARDQHTNFYENELSEYLVLEGLIECEEFSEQLYALFWPERP